MISAFKINKKFGKYHAIKDLSFNVGNGEIVGFLGKNGAGKTTLMRMLTSYLPMTSGKIEIFGMDIERRSLAIRKKIGYLSENLPIYNNMSVERYLMFSSQLKDIPAKKQRGQVERVLSICRLSHVSKKQIAILSKGYKQRVGIAQAIINEPELLILDEPTNGLDPTQVIQVRDIIKDLGSKRTVLLSTHILTEIEQLAHRVLIIKDGEKIVDESLQSLLTPKDKKKTAIFEVSGENSVIEEVVKTTDGIRLLDMARNGDRYIVTVEVSPDVYDYNLFVEDIIKAKVNLLGIREIKPGLEEIFLKLHA